MTEKCCNIEPLAIIFFLFCSGVLDSTSIVNLIIATTSHAKAAGQKIIKVKIVIIESDIDISELKIGAK